MGWSAQESTKLVIAFTMSIITALVCIFFYSFHVYHTLVVDTIALESKDRIEWSSVQLLKRINELYRMIGEHIHTHKEIIVSLRQRNKEALARASLPIFSILKGQDPELETMHFHTPDNKSFLRLHYLDDLDDDFAHERELIAYISQTGEPMSAIEVGEQGLGYRVGIPIYDGLSVVGVVEFGLGLEIFSRVLLESLGVDSAILLRKDKLKPFLDRNPLHELSNACEMGDYVFYKSCKNFTNSEWESFLNNYLYKVTDNGDHHVIFKGAELQDIHGESVGFLLVDRSINYYMDRAFATKKFSLFLGIVLWFAAFFLLYFGYKRYKKETQFYEDKLLENNRKLEHLSLYDHLTQIANRRNLEKLIRDEINRSKGGGFSLVLFDVDNFKRINDTYGHGMGDEVLKGLAHLAETTIRKGDVAGRWGGEEFILWLPSSKGEEALQIAECLRSNIEAHTFDERFGVTCSFGVGEFHADMDFDTLLNRVDDALYRAKNEGKNRVILA